MIARLFVFLYFVVLFEKTALAYTDPGSALLLWQGLVSGCFGVIFYFRSRIRKLFRREK